MSRDYSNRWYLVVHLPLLTRLQFYTLVIDYAVETHPTTCRYSVDPIDGISRFAILKFDNLRFDGDEPQILKDRVLSILNRVRRQSFVTLMRTTYGVYFPDEHDEPYVLRFSDRDVELSR